MSFDLADRLADATPAGQTGQSVLKAADDRLGSETRSVADVHVPTTSVFGLPLAKLTLPQTVETVGQLIDRGRPAFFITANLNYAMLSARSSELRELNRTAAFLTADGMPLIWGARLKCGGLPERVTGADLTPQLCGLAAERGYPVFIVGAASDVALEAAKKMQCRYSGLRIAGVASPNLSLLSASDEAELVQRIRDSQARLVFVAFGQPKGELWIARNYRAIGNAVCVQVGAAIDFAAERIARAPGPMQRLGLEWLYRIYREPRRLVRRYADNLGFLCGCAVKGAPRALAAWGRAACSNKSKLP